MRVLSSAFLGVVVLASACAYHSATAGQGATSAVACERARSEAYADRAEVEGGRRSAAAAPLAAQAFYDMANAATVDDYRSASSMYEQARSLERRSWSSSSGLPPRQNRWAERCRLARQREREAELQRQQIILTP